MTSWDIQWYAGNVEISKEPHTFQKKKKNVMEDSFKEVFLSREVPMHHGRLYIPAGPTLMMSCIQGGITWYPYSAGPPGEDDH